MTTAAVAFAIGDDRYVVPAGRVREVVAGVRPTRLPTAPAELLGLLNLRGEVVPLIDTAGLLGVGRVADAPVALVVETPSGVAGLAVEGRPEVVALDGEIGPSQLPATLGMYGIGDGIAVLIDVDALLEPLAATSARR